MNFIFYIMYFNIVSILASTLSTKPNLCINCKYFTKEFLTAHEFGKCTKFPKEDDDSNFFVNGVKPPEKKEFHYCSTSRKFNHMCGNEGKYYEKK